MTLPPISKKQQEILNSHYRFRFLNGRHIQKLLNHKNPSLTNTWLKDLVTKNYLGHIRSDKFGENTKPTVYYLSKNGIKYLHTQPFVQKKYISRLYTEKKKKEPFIRKCFCIADYFLQQVRNHPQIKEFLTQTDYPVNSRVHELEPSFGFKKHNGKKLEEYIAEVLVLGKPPYVTQGILEKYISYFTEMEKVSMHVIFVCPTQTIFKFVNRFLRSEDNYLENVTFHVTTYWDLVNGDIGKAIKNDL